MSVRIPRRGFSTQSLWAILGAALVLLLGASSAQAQVATYTGAQPLNPTGTLTFNWNGGGSLANYTEAGLSVTCPGGNSGQGCTRCCRPGGFSVGGYYMSIGVQALVRIARADGGAMSALEFQAGDYYNGCAYPGGDGTIYIWALVHSGGNVESFNINVPSGAVVGFSGVFDVVEVAAYPSAGVRDLHAPAQPQAIALDNMRYVSSPCPGFAPPATIYSCADGTKTFSVNVVGAGPISYQWQWQTLGGTSWTDVTEGVNTAVGALSFTATGSHAPTLNRIGALTPGSVVLYRCIVSNACSTITSAPARLAIRAAPLFIAQPQNLPLCNAPAVATFSVMITTTPSDPGPFTYQWQTNSGNGLWTNIVNGENTTGATGPGLVMSLDANDGAGGYRCIVTNPCASTISNTATLSFGNSPAIFVQPVSTTLCPSGSAELAADVGNQQLAARWQFESPPNSGQYLDVSDYWTTDPATGLTFYALGAASTGMSVSYISLGSHPPAIRFIDSLSNGCGSITTTPVTITLCAADFDCNGTFSVADIFAFLSAWFARDPRADFNGFGGVNVEDIFDFLGAWFAGCP